MQYWDIHAHIQFPEFAHDYKDVCARMKEHQVSALLVGVDNASSEEALRFVEQESNLFATAGVHPNDKKEVFDRNFYTELVRHKKMVAVGECGLDFFRQTKTDEEVTRQQKLFGEHIELAIDTGLPLMIHARDAHEEVIDMLRSYKKESPRLTGNIHFFTGTTDIARQYIDLGFTVSFTGVITFAREYDDLVRFVPEGSFMTETDCPYATPIPFRGKRNEPSFVPYIVEHIASLRGVSREHVRDDVNATVSRVFPKVLV